MIGSGDTKDWQCCENRLNLKKWFSSHRRNKLRRCVILRERGRELIEEDESGREGRNKLENNTHTHTHTRTHTHAHTHTAHTWRTNLTSRIVRSPKSVRDRNTCKSVRKNNIFANLIRTRVFADTHTHILIYIYTYIQACSHICILIYNICAFPCVKIVQSTLSVRRNERLVRALFLVRERVKTETVKPLDNREGKRHGCGRETARENTPERKSERERMKKKERERARERAREKV